MGFFLSLIFPSIPVTDLDFYIIAVAQSTSGRLGNAENKRSLGFLLVGLGRLASVSLGMKALSPRGPLGVFICQSLSHIHVCL